VRILISSSSFAFSSSFSPSSSRNDGKSMRGESGGGSHVCDEEEGNVGGGLGGLQLELEEAIGVVTGQSRVGFGNKRRTSQKAVANGQVCRQLNAIARGVFSKIQIILYATMSNKVK
jgi:hypothetical protein